jgi:molybdate transport system substrate-binding protein
VPADYSFAGSDLLQMQIERGAPADVFASADPEHARALFREGRCERPATFATNTLVLLVPRGNPGQVRSVASLEAGGRRLAVGTPGVPIGAYTRTLLRRLGLPSILRRNTVSEESNVANLTGKVALGSADAGFAYATDARAAGTRVETVELPKRAQPRVRYEVCVVKRDGADTNAARTYVERLLSTDGRAVLTRAGFGVPR